MVRKAMVADWTIAVVKNVIAGLPVGIYYPGQSYFIPEDGTIEVFSFEEVLEGLLAYLPQQTKELIEIYVKNYNETKGAGFNTPQ